MHFKSLFWKGICRDRGCKTILVALEPAKAMIDETSFPYPGEAGPVAVSRSESVLQFQSCSLTPPF